MENWTGAVRVGPPDGPLVLLTATQLQPTGKVTYTCSISPGVSVTLVTTPGPAMLPPDDPAIVAVVLDLEAASHGYANHDG